MPWISRSRPVTEENSREFFNQVKELYHPENQFDEDIREESTKDEEDNGEAQKQGFWFFGDAAF